MSSRRHLVLAAAMAALLGAGCSTVDAPTGPAAPPTTVRCDPEPALDVPYADIDGVDPALVSLDLHPPPGACEGAGRPIVVWVHGGGWAVGDKSQLGAKQEWAAAHGWLLVSVDYRLSPSPPSEDPRRVMHPTHVEDVARALAWVDAHAAEHGGDPSRVALIGHSAGGHLVSLISVDQRYLAAAGAPSDLVDCTAALDTEGYDLLAKVGDGEAGEAMTRNAFGDDPNRWRDASPITQIESGEYLPRFLVVTRGLPERRDIAGQFEAALAAAGADTSLLVAAGYSHADVNRRLGQADDSVVTPAVDQFLADCFADTT
jgi:acetyl esterase/lipase